MKQKYLLYNHTEEKGRKLTILRSQKKNGRIVVPSQVLLPTLVLYPFLWKSQTPLPHMTVASPSPKAEKRPSYHYVLSLTGSTLGQQSVAAASKKL